MEIRPVGFGGKRLDVFISDNKHDFGVVVSRSYAQKLIALGYVLVNGNTAKKNQTLGEGDCVCVRIPEPEQTFARAQNIALDVVFEDQDIIVINKPFGMVVHPAGGNHDGTLVNALLYHCAGRLSDINGVIRPGIVHRLDKDTSGLIVAAKSNTAHRGLAEDFKERRITKLYSAIVEGHVKPDSGLIDLPIGRHKTIRNRMAVPDEMYDGEEELVHRKLGKTGKDAVTKFFVKERLAGGSTLLNTEIITGRTHQIRVHLSYIGHPIVGDRVYGVSPKGGDSQREQLLHASRLEFDHPVSGKRLVFTCPLPDYFEAYILRER